VLAEGESGLTEWPLLLLYGMLIGVLACRLMMWLGYRKAIYGRWRKR
jgi:hypothetical protein